MATKPIDFEIETRDLMIEQLPDAINVVEEEDIPLNGTCPYADLCQVRRQRLPTYRPGHPCHWRAWGDWQRCPIFGNNELMEKAA